MNMESNDYYDDLVLWRSLLHHRAHSHMHIFQKCHFHSLDKLKDIELNLHIYEMRDTDCTTC